MISKQANLLLTSAGPTTHDLQDHLRYLASHHKSKRPSIIRVTDGMVGLEKGNRLWTNRYLKHTLGQYTLKDVRAASFDVDVFKSSLEGGDILLVPGGNTFHTMIGVSHHAETIRAMVNEGEIAYVGESAGSIIAGDSLAPAMLPPADKQPSAVPESGLGLVDGHIIVHAAGRERRFEIPGLVGSLATRLFERLETGQEVIAAYKQALGSDINVYTIQNDQALFVSGGLITLV